MSTLMADTGIQQIGATAGTVWRVLSEEGPMSLAKLARSVEAPRDVVMQAVGWLAREDKIVIEDGSRGRVIGLR